MRGLLLNAIPRALSQIMKFGFSAEPQSENKRFLKWTRRKREKAMPYSNFWQIFKMTQISGWKMQQVAKANDMLNIAWTSGDR